jgi:Fe-S-cluster containining protein
MSDAPVNGPFESPFSSPLVPTGMGLDDTIQFQCRKGIACFNQCCQNIDITLTPYDVVRLKNRLGLTSQAFLHLHTVPFEMDGAGMPGLKLKTREDTPACQFVTEEGCSVYEDRPSACRYYALGQMAVRKTGSTVDEDMYFLVKEEHCLGHQEPREITIRDYRKEQQVEDFDEINRGWRQVVLKKRSTGPTVGRPSQRSYQLFFMASYDMDGFLEFILSDGFQALYDLDAELLEKLKTDEVERIKFGARLLKQVLFGENTILHKPGAADERLERRRAEINARLAAERGEDVDERYDASRGE